MENYNQKFIEQQRYERAAKQVKRLKSFYTHALVFLLVNLFLLILKYKGLNDGEHFFQFKNFSTVFFWGIGLVAHGLSVFLPQLALGKDWEERKIREYMEQNKNERKRWE